MRYDLKYKSDHKVVVLEFENRTTRGPKHLRFHFQAAWLLEHDFPQIVSDAWSGKDWIQGVSQFQESVSKWNEENIGSIPGRKKALLKRLEGIKQKKAAGEVGDLFKIETKLWKEYTKLALQEEMLWFQKSHCLWIRGGDKNTRFFHATVVVKAKRQKVSTLQNEDGVWISELSLLKQMATEFFTKLYTAEPTRPEREDWPVLFPPLRQ